MWQLAVSVVSRIPEVQSLVDTRVAPSNRRVEVCGVGNSLISAFTPPSSIDSRVNFALLYIRSEFVRLRYPVFLQTQRVPHTVSRLSTMPGGVIRKLLGRSRTHLGQSLTPDPEQHSRTGARLGRSLTPDSEQSGRHSRSGARLARSLTPDPEQGGHRSRSGARLGRSLTPDPGQGGRHSRSPSRPADAKPRPTVHPHSLSVAASPPVSSRSNTDFSAVVA